MNPQIFPLVNNSSAAPLVSTALPGPARLGAHCQSQTQGTRAPYAQTQQSVRILNGRSCPYFNARAKNTTALLRDDGLAMLCVDANPKTPTWTEDILLLIKSPYWVSEDKSNKGARWIGAMKQCMGWSLDDFDDVRKRAEGIYRHLRSKSMPITQDPQDYWPEEALETFRSWVNGGFPRGVSDAPAPKMVIPNPLDPAPSFKVQERHHEIEQGGTCCIPIETG